MVVKWSSDGQVVVKSFPNPNTFPLPSSHPPLTIPLPSGQQAEAEVLNHKLSLDYGGYITRRSFKQLLDPQNEDKAAAEEEGASLLGWCTLWFKPKPGSGSETARGKRGSTVATPRANSPLRAPPSTDLVPDEKMKRFEVTIRPHTSWKQVFWTETGACRRVTEGTSAISQRCTLHILIPQRCALTPMPHCATYNPHPCLGGGGGCDGTGKAPKTRTLNSIFGRHQN